MTGLYPPLACLPLWFSTSPRFPPTAGEGMSVERARGRAAKMEMPGQGLCSAHGSSHPHPIRTRKSCFLCQPGVPIPAAQQKGCPHLAFAHPGLVTRRAPSQRPPHPPQPLRVGRCEILIASLGTGLFLSVVSDQNIILSCKYNYRRGGGAARYWGGCVGGVWSWAVALFS